MGFDSAFRAASKYEERLKKGEVASIRHLDYDILMMQGSQEASSFASYLDRRLKEIEKDDSFSDDAKMQLRVSYKGLAEQARQPFSQ